jgi:hypothetical protein
MCVKPSSFLMIMEDLFREPVVCWVLAYERPYVGRTGSEINQGDFNL